MTETEKVLRELLISELKLLRKAKSNLLYSYDRVIDINISPELSPEELELLDSFSARFLRLYEVFSNQILRTVLQLLGEYQPTRVDNMLKAEQLYLVTSASDMNTMRILRNKIAHEYLQEEWESIYKNILEHSKMLLECIGLTEDYIRTREWID